MQKLVYSFGNGRAEGDPTRKDVLGGKGAGLAEMTSLGLPVPPGFTISTDACIAYLRDNAVPKGLEVAVGEALERMEASVGKKFGEGDDPLVVSVRSGARASMPGMMDTILNLGLNDRTVEALAARSKNRKFAFDAYRRFLTMFGDVALGVRRSKFEGALDEARGRVAAASGIDTTRLNAEELRKQVKDSDLPVEELERLVTEFKAIIEKETGSPFPADPHAQLWAAIRSVFASWNNHRAITYRRLHDIPDRWGTACNVQAMVFGNMGPTSATGVAFTRNPSTGEPLLYGEWLPDAQGEDVVAGIRTPLPLRKEEGHDSLEERMPAAFAELCAVATKLEDHFRDVQDLEFTVEDGTLYMLQCRTGKRTGRAAVRVAVDLAHEKKITKREAVLRVNPAMLDQLLHPTLSPDAPKTLLARGLPASPGAAQGQICFDANEAERLAAKGVSVLLVRVETSPEDIHGMKAATGILTARGGMTSHAAVVARGMGKPCVAGCSALSVNEADGTVTISVYEADGGPATLVRLERGDVLTIDGGKGEVYRGAVPTVPASLSGEFGELMAWADELRTMHVRANADTPGDARTARSFGAEGIGLCRTEHMFFEPERILPMREMILAEDEPSRSAALAKLLPMQRGDFLGIFEAMDGLPVTIRLLDPPLHEFLPDTDKQVDELAAALSVPKATIERRMKELHEFNPMLGHRGCRLAVTYPEIYAMQVRAILEAAREAAAKGIKVLPEIMIPLAMTRAELERMRALVERVASEVFASGDRIPFLFGTMIELPRAAVRASDLAEVAEFFSFGTNDLTQCTLGLSRDDAGKFLPSYVEAGLLPKDPFVSIDIDGVGSLVKIACERGRSARQGIKLGVCGEHGGDPDSIRFFKEVGLDYVSCSPFRVTIARLAAAQASVASAGAARK